MSVPKDGGLKAGAKTKNKDDGRVLVATKKASVAKPAAAAKKK